jgi:hypothetical protein
VHIVLIALCTRPETANDACFVYASAIQQALSGCAFAAHLTPVFAAGTAFAKASRTMPCSLLCNEGQILALSFIASVLCFDVCILEQGRSSKSSRRG